MDPVKNKIIGAFLIGFAIVAGAYTFKNFGESSTLPPTALSAAVANKAPERVVIEVTDADNNGLEDWKDQFVKNSPISISINDKDDNYVPPDTLTGQVGIAYMQGVIAAEGYKGIGQTKEQVLEKTVEKVKEYSSDTIFDFKDIKYSEDGSDQTIRRYANAMADAIRNNDIPGLRNELVVLNDIVNNLNEDGVKELKKIAGIYRGTRDDTLDIIVPPQLIKEHLDLINVYHSIYKDIESMSQTIEDPMLSLIRLKRYEDDVKGMALALQNMYTALAPYSGAFTVDDSALLFIKFRPKVKQENI